MQVDTFRSKEATGTGNLGYLLCNFLFTTQMVSFLIFLSPCYQYPSGPVLKTAIFTCTLVSTKPFKSTSLTVFSHLICFIIIDLLHLFEQIRTNIFALLYLRLIFFKSPKTMARPGSTYGKKNQKHKYFALYIRAFFMYMPKT